MVASPAPGSPAKGLASKAEVEAGRAREKVKSTDDKVRWHVHASLFGAADTVGMTVIPDSCTAAMRRFAAEGAGVPKILGRVPGSEDETTALLRDRGAVGIDMCGAPLSHPDLRTLGAALRSNPPELQYLDVRGSLDVRGQALYPKDEVAAAATLLEKEHVAAHGAFKAEGEGGEEGEEEAEDPSLEKLKEQLSAVSGEEFTDKAAAFKAIARVKLNRTDMLLAALEENRSLTFLSLAGNGLGTKDDGTRAFKQLRKVRQVIDDHPALLRLDLSDNKMGPKGTGTLLKGLVQNIHVTHVDVSGNDVGVEDEGEEDEGDAEDDPAFGEPLVGPVGVADLLKKNKFIRVLRLRDNGLKGPPPEMVPEMPNPEPEEEGGEPPPVPDDWDALTDDHKEDPFCKMILPLKTYHRLTTLDLSRNELGPGGAYIITAVLRGNKSVTSLDLSENALGVAGVKVLAQQLTKGTGNLRRLALARNDFAGLKCKYGKKKWRTMKEAVDELCLFLASDKNNVEELDLAYNNLGAEFGAAVVTALAKAPSKALQVVDLSMNQLGGSSSGEYCGDAVAPLCELLGALPLRALKLRWNFLQEEGAKALAAAIGGDMPAKHLRCLDASRNYIGPGGVDAIAAAVGGGHCLAELRLAANGRCAAAAASVAALVTRATALRVLDVADLALGTDGARALLDAAAGSKLQHLYAAKNEIGPAAGASLGAVLSSCATLRGVDAGDNDFGSGSISTDVIPRLRGNTTLRSLTVWGGEHGTPSNPSQLALAEKAAKLLADGGGSGLLLCDLGLPVALRETEPVAAIAESLFANLAAAKFAAPEELVPMWGGA